MSKLYVGNLAFDLDPRDLEDIFAKYGHVLNVSIKRGYGFVHFESAKDAEIAMAEMNGFDFNGRTIRVAYATASGGNGAPGGPGGPIDRRPYRDAPREGGSFSHTTGGHPSNIGNSYGGGNSYVGNNTNSSSNNNSGQVSRNLFVANIPPHLKLNEVEAFFDQYGEVENIKVLPQARGNAALSAFVDFTEVGPAQKAHESDLVLDGQLLRTDYNFRRRREEGENGGADNHGGRGGGGYGGGGYDGPSGGGSSHRPRQDSFEERPSYSSRPRNDRYEEERGGGGSRRAPPARYSERSRSPAFVAEPPRGSSGHRGHDRDRSRDRGSRSHDHGHHEDERYVRRGSGGSNDYQRPSSHAHSHSQQHQHHSERSPPIRSSGGSREYRTEERYSRPTEDHRRPARSPPRGRVEGPPPPREYGRGRPSNRSLSPMPQRPRSRSR